MVHAAAGAGLPSRPAAPAPLTRIVATGLAALVLAACGDEDAGNRLVWKDEPRIFAPRDLPDDRILSGQVRNGSSRRIELAAKELRLLDGDGRRIEANAVFLQTYAHQLYPPARPPKGGVPESELLRLGVKARLEPGAEAPLTVSWRRQPGGKPPARLETAAGSLPIEP